MANLVESALLLPKPGEWNRNFADYSQKLIGPNVQWTEKSNEELSALYPVANTARALSRSALLLSAITRMARPHLEKYISADPFSVGIYCAIEQGPIGFSLVQKLPATNGDFARSFKKNFPPKQYLKHLPMIAAACPGIFLGAKGPIQVFNHSLHAAHHALDHCVADLNLNRIKAGYVCAANSLEDPLVTLRNQGKIPASRVLSEGAAFLIVTPANINVKLWECDQGSTSRPFYGIADPLIQTILNAGDES